MAPQKLSVTDLLTTDSYVIPLYQRNYAWGHTEILQLLQDIWDKHKEKEKRTYYIGTLVVNKWVDGKYEIVDGQQRHTTLTLINAVAKGKCLSNLPVSSLNLAFDARNDVETFLERLYSSYALTRKNPSASIGITNLLSAVDEIEMFFAQPDKKDQQAFWDYFYNCVKIIRIGLPDDTDINHYFEVMNNRGEQLEKHEIVKARLLEKLKGTEHYTAFAVIWDACSQMDRPVQACFNVDFQKTLFGEDLSGIPENINGQVLRPATEAAGGSTLLELLQSAQGPEIPRQNHTPGESKYKSIINFSNFLLHVRKLKKPDTSLDDKNLLDAFALLESKEEIGDFIALLLKCRVLFDRYIIKRLDEKEEPAWCLISPVLYESKLDFRNTFGKEDKEKDDEEDLGNLSFIMIQSMLQVSFPGNSYKNWLFEALDYLQNAHAAGLSPQAYPQVYLVCLQEIARRKFLATGPEQHISGSTRTPRLIFYYLDYLLWLEYSEHIKNGKTDTSLRQQISRCKNKFRAFRFTYNNSVEHVAPQTPSDGSKPVELVHYFGNLCLISSSTNSKVSNRHFNEKKAYLKSSKTVESLKQTLIFEHEIWNDEIIAKHAKEVLELLGLQKFALAFPRADESSPDK